MDQLQKLLDLLDRWVDTIKESYQKLGPIEKTFNKELYERRLHDVQYLKKYIEDVLIPEAAYKP